MAHVDCQNVYMCLVNGVCCEISNRRRENLSITFAYLLINIFFIQINRIKIKLHNILLEYI